MLIYAKVLVSFEHDATDTKKKNSKVKHFKKHCPIPTPGEPTHTLGISALGDSGLGLCKAFLDYVY